MNAFKKLLTVIPILLCLSSSASLIRDTIPSSKDNVVLKPAVAIAALQDLARFDGCKEIVKIMEGQIIDLKTIIAQKDQVISEHRVNEKSYLAIRANDQEIIQTQRGEINEISKKYRRSVRWGRFKVVLLPVAGAAGLYLGSKLF